MLDDLNSVQHQTTAMEQMQSQTYVPGSAKLKPSLKLSEGNLILVSDDEVNERKNSNTGKKGANGSKTSKRVPKYKKVKSLGNFC